MKHYVEIETTITKEVVEHITCDNCQSKISKDKISVRIENRIMADWDVMELDFCSVGCLKDFLKNKAVFYSISSIKMNGQDFKKIFLSDDDAFEIDNCER